jgi:protoporphyrin/coproporphyrin ferrochelatase
VSEPLGVLVLSHGTPSSPGDVERLYTAIRRGRPPTPEQLGDLQRRYDAIGGVSPLAERTSEQVAGVARALAARRPGRVVVEGGTKYAEPTIEAAAGRLRDAGCVVVVGIVLSPLDAATSTAQYHERAAAALGDVDYRAVSSWWDASGFVPLLADRLDDALAAAGGEPLVCFTAHSLPVRVAPPGSAYPTALAAAAAAVAAATGVTSYQVCWQSAGRTADEWLGPDVLEVVRGLDPAAVDRLVVCPIGFVSDHLEVLFDLDVEATALAASRGVALSRTASLNDEPKLSEVLADVVERAA